MVSHISMNRVVLASGNHDKVAEIQVLLQEFSIELISQSAYAVEPVEESGQSFVENAIIKARHAARLTRLPAIADDSGICVDALDGAPGIYSARYAGPHSSDEENVQKLLYSMRDVPDGSRSVRFECAMVFLAHPSDPTPLVSHGSWRGDLLREPRGENGFGYDPVFYVPVTGCACAELDGDSKNLLSHRGQAARRLVQRLSEHPGSG